MLDVRTVREATNGALLDSLRDVVTRLRDVTALLLAHIAEVDARRLYLDAACSSMFSYCTERLGFDEGAAYKRITGARVIRRFPLALELISTGRIHLAGLCVLAPHLTPANHQSLLAAASGRSRRAIEKLVADLAPRPAAPSSIRRLPEPAPSHTPGTPSPPSATLPLEPSRDAEVGLSQVKQPAASPGAVQRVGDPRPQSPGGDHRRPADLSGACLSLDSGDAPTKRSPSPAVCTVSPLGASRYRIQLTATEATVGKLRKTQALLGHQVPDGDVATVIDRALTLLCEDLERRRFGSPRRPGRGPKPGKPRPARAAAPPQGAPEDSVATRPGDSWEASPASSRETTHGDSVVTRPGDSCGASPASSRETTHGDSVVTRPGDSDATGPASDVTFRPADTSAAQEPRHSQPVCRTRAIPVAFRRAVWERDGGRCAFVDASGRRCTETRRLELDHIVPFARGGDATVANLRLACRPHNQHAARQAFGSDYVRRRVEAARSDTTKCRSAGTRARARGQFDRELSQSLDQAPVQLSVGWDDGCRSCAAGGDGGSDTCVDLCARDATTRF